MVERESESGGKLGELDSYEIEGAEAKSEVLQNLTEFQFSCVSIFLFKMHLPTPSLNYDFSIINFIIIPMHTHTQHICIHR